MVTEEFYREARVCIPFEELLAIILGDGYILGVLKQLAQGDDQTFGEMVSVFNAAGMDFYSLILSDVVSNVENEVLREIIDRYKNTSNNSSENGQDRQNRVERNAVVRNVNEVKKVKEAPPKEKKESDAEREKAEFVFKQATQADSYYEDLFEEVYNETSDLFDEDRNC